jgi:hypothetical protein
MKSQYRPALWWQTVDYSRWYVYIKGNSVDVFLMFVRTSSARKPVLTNSFVVSAGWEVIFFWEQNLISREML